VLIALFIVGVAAGFVSRWSVGAESWKPLAQAIAAVGVLALGAYLRGLRGQ
jgi:hypothetical protein